MGLGIVSSIGICLGLCPNTGLCLTGAAVGKDSIYFLSDKVKGERWSLEFSGELAWVLQGST